MLHLLWSMDRLARACDVVDSRSGGQSAVQAVMPMQLVVAGATVRAMARRTIAMVPLHSLAGVHRVVMIWCSPIWTSGSVAMTYAPHGACTCPPQMRCRNGRQGYMIA